MEPTVLVYASHDRSNLIHNDWIVQRALRGSRRILFLPLSTPSADDDEMRHQRAAWESFNWFFRYYAPYGLNAFPFFWHSGLQRADVDLLWSALGTADVVILGGGYPALGMSRFAELGRRFYDDPDRFRRMMHERQAAGLLTAGFSAGADQLCELMSSESGPGQRTAGLGVARDVIATSHFEPGQEPWLRTLAATFPSCLLFGLPNDSALAVAEGETARGAWWQVIHMVVDLSWDRPEDGFHIKTRQGVPIQHFYPDGRHWAFRGGDRLVRVRPASREADEIWILAPNAPVRDYATGEPSAFDSLEAILAAK